MAVINQEPMAILSSTFSALEAKNNFGRLIEMAQQSPVTVTKNGRPSIIVISVEDYELKQRLNGKRLLASIHRLAEEAETKGITESDISKLLQDDN